MNCLVDGMLLNNWLKSIGSLVKEKIDKNHNMVMLEFTNDYLFVHSRNAEIMCRLNIPFKFNNGFSGYYLLEYRSLLSITNNCMGDIEFTISNNKLVLNLLGGYIEYDSRNFNINSFKTDIFETNEPFVEVPNSFVDVLAFSIKSFKMSSNNTANRIKISDFKCYLNFKFVQVVCNMSGIKNIGLREIDSKVLYKLLVDSESFYRPVGVENGYHFRSDRFELYIPNTRVDDIDTDYDTLDLTTDFVSVNLQEFKSVVNIIKTNAPMDGHVKFESEKGLLQIGVDTPTGKSMRFPVSEDSYKGLFKMMHFINVVGQIIDLITDEEFSLYVDVGKDEYSCNVVFKFDEVKVYLPSIM
jgi:hypothetical protein